ncbi:YceI family protein [Pedobacter psychroterrae]|uniref:YceI family protein n=1 Tax=Pedobacter psychroterrae TaxID=2530453 RepID=A0A4R0NPS9_9SPHI|nr:YceI family protein [Pedobacter psychroterrae]TCD01104.1 YceI family protein [Pedobacter psychroterrae]
MKRKLLYPIAFMIAFSVIGMQTQAQYKLSTARENTVKISGGSNVHGWTMIAQNPVCEAAFGSLTTGENTPKSLTSLSFSVNTKSLKSEHSSMDGRTYKTLKAEQFPKITFKLSNATITPVKKNKFSVKANGTLTIAGSSKAITMMVNGEVKEDGSINCTGQQKLKLTDFNIQPPSFMLGAMKVDNDLTIDYNFTFKN